MQTALLVSVTTSTMCLYKYSMCFMCLIMYGAIKAKGGREDSEEQDPPETITFTEVLYFPVKLEMCLISGDATLQCNGGPAQPLFYLVSKHICQSNTSQYKDELSGDTSLAIYPVSNQHKQTISGYKDDSVHCERTSVGPLQGDRECDATFLNVFLPLIK